MWHRRKPLRFELAAVGSAFLATSDAAYVFSMNERKPEQIDVAKGARLFVAESY